MFSEKTRIVAASAIGNVLEWFDFAIYGYFAITIGQTFFPHQDPVAQLLSTFGVFAIGCLMRPLGSLLSGSIGDRYGRRAALTVSMFSKTGPVAERHSAANAAVRATESSRSRWVSMVMSVK